MFVVVVGFSFVMGEETGLLEADRELFPLFSVELGRRVDADLLAVDVGDTVELAMVFFDRVLAKLAFVVAVVFVVLFVGALFYGFVLDAVWLGQEFLFAHGVRGVALGDGGEAKHGTASRVRGPP